VATGAHKGTTRSDEKVVSLVEDAIGTSDLTMLFASALRPPAVIDLVVQHHESFVIFLDEDPLQTHMYESSLWIRKKMSISVSGLRNMGSWYRVSTPPSVSNSKLYPVTVGTGHLTTPLS
jgi:hypothetical protein